MTIRSLRGVSALALIIGVSGLSEALAQQATTSEQTVTTRAAGDAQGEAAASAVEQTQAAADQKSADKVIVTGSFIRTLPEDAPKPVEVYTAADLEDQGAPTMTEFIRSLTISYGDDLGFGQASPDVPQGTGFGNANLRGLGSNGTLVLMNGRRLAPWNGSYGADVNGIPTEALEAVEVLRDGASATYGAGAVGGVLNFRTRRDINAPQISLQKQIYDGSDGYYKVDFLTGWAGDSSNLLVSLSHSHEEPMLQTARAFSSLPSNVNPAQWTYTGSNPGVFRPFIGNFHTASGTVALNNTASGFIPDYRTAADCTAIGGAVTRTIQPNAVFTGTVPNTSCAFSQAPFQGLVNENDTYRAYVEYNGAISDTMEFHFDVTYNSSITPQLRIPSDPASATAVACTGCNYVLPVQVQTFTPAIGSSPTQAAGVGTGVFYRNPFVDDFMSRTGLTAGTLPSTGALYLGTLVRPLLFGGYPGTESGLREDRFERDGFIFNAGVNGEFSTDTMLGKLLNGASYDFAGQYNQYLNTYMQPDIFASRLQNALLGYGGPNCNAVDRVPTDYTSQGAFNRTVGIQSNTAPGTNGCEWFNPFASAWPVSVANNQANPQFNNSAIAGRPTGYRNSPELLDWLIGSRVAEYKLESVTFDGLITGAIPDTMLTLPGGEIGWAVGTQWRQVEGRSSTRDDVELEENMATQQCVWPDRNVRSIPAQPDQVVGQLGCASLTSAFYNGSRVNIVTTIPPYYYDTQTIAYFGELSLPVLDNLNLSLNYRREAYNGGDLTGDIWSVAAKYNVTDNLYLRYSYGTNWRADGALELDPGAQVFSTSTQSRFGSGFQVTDIVTVSDGIGPEDDRTLNVGIGWESDIFEGRVRASIDFFEIIIDGQVATTATATILNNVFGLNTAAAQGNRGVTGIPNTAAANSSGQFANCNANLIAFVSFTTPCVQGVTTAASLTSINRFQLNGPGFATNGIDYSIDFAYPLFDGTLSANLTATQNLVYKARGYAVNGTLFDAGGDRLGSANYTRTGNESREWRGNASVRWKNDVHNIGLRANYNSGVFNEAFLVGGLTPISNSPTVYSTYGVYPQDSIEYDLTYIYTAPFMQGLDLRASILNLTDEDPQPAQGRTGYYGATGNPRGRIIELGLTKKF
jgi:outer membrane receptor protein involved in Fe transport